MLLRLPSSGTDSLRVMGERLSRAVTSLSSLSALPTALSLPAAGTFLSPTKVPEVLP